MSEIDPDVWFEREPQTPETPAQREQRIARERRERTAAIMREDTLFAGERAPETPADDLPTLWKQAQRELHKRRR